MTSGIDSPVDPVTATLLNIGVVKAIISESTALNAGYDCVVCGQPLCSHETCALDRRMSYDDMGLLNLQGWIYGSICAISEPWWKVWAIRRKRYIFGVIKGFLEGDREKPWIWTRSGLGAQCVCGLVDAMDTPGRPYAVKALQQIGPARIQSIQVRDEDTNTRERLASALRLIAYEHIATKPRAPATPPHQNR